VEENSDQNLRLSVSKTKVFSACKKQYEFIYVKKLPRIDRDYHVFGKFLHKCLEDFHLAYINGSTSPYNEILGFCFKTAKLEYGDLMTAEMLKEARAMLKEYLDIIVLKKQNNQEDNVIAVEKSFSINIHKNLILNGLIDRVQIDRDGTINVGDYKTTKNKKYLVDDNFQLKTYAYALWLEDQSITKIRGSYILLRHNYEYINFEFNLDDILSVPKTYEEYYDEIIKEAEYKANPTFMCHYCDFLPLCDEGKAKVKPQLTHGEVVW
jgi:RecB family exonuclease